MILRRGWALTLEWGGAPPAPDLHSKILDPLPLGSKFFQFHTVFVKIWQNRMLAPPAGLAPPSWGNPGSATGRSHILFYFLLTLQWDLQRFPWEIPVRLWTKFVCFRHNRWRRSCVSVNRSSRSAVWSNPPQCRSPQVYLQWKQEI